MKLTEEQKEVLRERYADTRTQELADLLGVGYYSVCKAAASMGLRKSPAFCAAMSANANKALMAKYGKRSSKKAVLTEDGEAWLRAHYATEPDVECAKYLGISPRTVRRYAKRLGLKKEQAAVNRRRAVALLMPAEERAAINAAIKKHYPDANLQELSRTLGYSVGTIRGMAGNLGVHRSREATRKYWKKRGPCERIQKLEADLKVLYPTLSNAELAARTGFSEAMVKAVAFRLGLKKDKTYLTRTRREIRERIIAKSNLMTNTN